MKILKPKKCFLKSLNENNLRLLIDYSFGFKTQKNEKQNLNQMAFISCEILRLNSKSITQFFFKEEKREEDTKDNSKSDLGEIEQPLNDLQVNQQCIYKQKSIDSDNKKGLFEINNDHLTLDNEEIHINYLQALNYPNLNYLMKFKDISEECDYYYTICSYFCQILTNLIQIEPDKFLTWVYSKNDFIDFLIDKIEYISIQKLFFEILNLQKNDDYMHYDCKFLKHRYLLYLKLLNKLSTVNKIKQFSIAQIFTDLIENKFKIMNHEFFLEKLFYEKQKIENIFQKSLQTLNKSLLQFIKVLFKEVFQLNKQEEEDKQSNQSDDDLDEDYLLQSSNSDFGDNLFQSKQIQDINLTNSNQSSSLEKQNSLSPINSQIQKQISSLRYLSKKQSGSFSSINGSQSDQLISDNINFEKNENVFSIEQTSTIKDIEIDIYEPTHNDNQQIYVNIFIENFELIKNILFNNKKSSLLQADGFKVAIYSTQKLMVLELLCIISQIQNKQIKEKLIEDDIMKNLLKMFLEFPRNNIMHHLLNQILKSQLSYLCETIDQIRREEKLDEFLNYLYKDFFLFLKEVGEEEIKRKYFFIGYFYQLTKFFKSQLDTIQPIYENENWLKFQDEYLLPKMNNPQYLGNNPNEVIQRDQLNDIIDFHFDNTKMMAKFNTKKQKRVVLNLDENTINQDEDNIQTNLAEDHLKIISNLQFKNKSIDLLDNSESEEFISEEEEEEILFDQCSSDNEGSLSLTKSKSTDSTDRLTLSQEFLEDIYSEAIYWKCNYKYQDIEQLIKNSN